MQYRRNEPVHRCGNFRSLQIAPSKVSAATLTVHVIIYCLRPTAKTLLIVTFIFGACTCAIRREIRPVYCHPLASFSAARILFARCMWYAREIYAFRFFSVLEAYKTMEGGRWYCRIFRYARKENLSKDGEDVLKSNNMFRKGCETSQFYRLRTRL